jgi:uncharacterized phage protein (TIGR01671 family)
MKMNNRLKFRVYIPEFSKLVYFEFNNFDHSDRYLDNPEHPVQQYTGMKDKYGKDIYEGDIVINTTSKEEYCSPAVIVWGKYEFVGFALAYKRNKLEDYHAPLIHKINGVDLVEEFNLSKIGIYQIVGNVSENPELLK